MSIVTFDRRFEQSMLTPNSIRFTKGIPSKLEYSHEGKNQTVTDSVALFLAVNTIAKRNGVGRIDIVWLPNLLR